MTDFIYGSPIQGQFDTQIDSNHRWDEDRVTEIDVYPMSLTNEGFHETDMVAEPLASRRVPNAETCEDMWYGNTDMEDEAIKALPENILKAFKEAIAEATENQTKFEGGFKYEIGDTVFITEHRFPADVEAYTVNGGYIVNMANSGELAEFAPHQLEDYDNERWNAE